MDIITIILIAVGLAMDCFAVSITQGLQEGKWHYRALWMALLFGLFQGGMPLIGYYMGTVFSAFFSRFAPWIALLLLGFLGGKMVVESCKKNEDDSCLLHADKGADFRVKHLITLAVATSIDALATGVIFIPVPNVMWMGIGVIALVSFLFALSGYIIGWLLGCRFRVNVERIGGIILMGIGIKIFIEGICIS